MALNSFRTPCDGQRLAVATRTRSGYHLFGIRMCRGRKTALGTGFACCTQNW